MKSEEQATARPWRVSVVDETLIVSGEKFPDDVCRTTSTDEDYEENYERRAADAALIVKAVNSHDALVKALQDLSLEVLGQYGAFGDGLREAVGNTNFRVVLDKLDAARAALKQAGAA